MKKTYLLLSLFSLIPNLAIAAYSAKGFVVDDSNEPIIGAAICRKGDYQNCKETNDTGFFSIELTEDTKELEISYIGNSITIDAKETKPGDTPQTYTLKSQLIDDVIVCEQGKIYKETTKKCEAVYGEECLSKDKNATLATWNEEDECEISECALPYTVHPNENKCIDDYVSYDLLK